MGLWTPPQYRSFQLQVVIPPTAATPGMVVNVPSATNIPGSAGDRAAAAGATIVTVPQNSTEIPEQLKQFEPK